MSTHDILGFRSSASFGARICKAARGYMAGLTALLGVGALGRALLTWSVSDPSLNHATNAPIHNLLGSPGAIAADIVMQMLGLACIAALAPPAFWGWRLLTHRQLERPRLKAYLYLAGVAAAAAFASLLPVPGSWPLPTGLGGGVGDALFALPLSLFASATWRLAATGAAYAAAAVLCLTAATCIGLAQRPHEEGSPEAAVGQEPRERDFQEGQSDSDEDWIGERNTQRRQGHDGRRAERSRAFTRPPPLRSRASAPFDGAPSKHGRDIGP